MLEHKSLELITSLKMMSYAIHFPSGYKFTLRVPQEVTVKEMTELMRNYTALHSTYGININGRVLEPLFLASLGRDFVADLFLSDPNFYEHDLSPLTITDFRILYSSERKSSPKVSQCPGPNFHFIGKMMSCEENNLKKNSTIERESYICRNKKNCQLFRVTKFVKSKLSFVQFEGLVCMRDYHLKASQDHNNQFMNIHSSFETEFSLCLVSKLYPFQLDRIKIENKFLLDFILGQIARIVHILERDNVAVADVSLRDFWMDFRFQVHYCGMLEFRKNLKDSKNTSPIKECLSEEEDQQKNFCQSMIILVEELFKNCNAKLLESYFPLFHWFKNQRITNYLEFLKYFQTNSFEDNQENKKKAILEGLMKSYSFPPIDELTSEDTSEFTSSYIPQTSIFVMHESKISIPEKSAQRSCKILDEVVENISTIKKKKQDVAICSKPLYLAREFLKHKKSKTKPKNKSELAHQLNKSSKSKKHKKRISEFLIDD